jgi:hypothetical protein
MRLSFLCIDIGPYDQLILHNNHRNGITRLYISILLTGKVFKSLQTLVTCKSVHSTTLISVSFIIEQFYLCLKINWFGTGTKQIWKPVEQDRRPGYESTQLCPPYFCQRHQKSIEKRQSLQQMLLGKLDIHLQKIETRSMPVTLY